MMASYFAQASNRGELSGKKKSAICRSHGADSRKNGGVCEPISAPLFMRGETNHRPLSHPFLAIKTATYSASLTKKENKSSKNERNFHQVDLAECVFMLGEAIVTHSRCQCAQFRHIHLDLEKTKKQHNSKLSLTSLACNAILICVIGFMTPNHGG